MNVNKDCEGGKQYITREGRMEVEKLHTIFGFVGWCMKRWKKGKFRAIKIKWSHFHKS